MSFESVFEKWLCRQDSDQQSETMNTGVEDNQHTMAELDPAGDPGAEEEMPEIQQEAWREEDVKDMPVLQRMDSPPLSPPPPLQITISLKDSQPASRYSSASETPKTGYRNKSNSEKKDKGEGKDSVMEKSSGESGVGERKHPQCRSKSALLELTDLSHGTSPTAPRSLEVDLAESGDHPSQEAKNKSPHHCAVSKLSSGALKDKARPQMLSPDRDCPMEPDSTSECQVKYHRPRLGSDTLARGVDVSPRCEVSPRSTGCPAGATPGNSCSEMGLAECDSTSMFMSSPSAISPASQGDEERGCPVLTDHEDGASPAHCVCQCRSLPPPTDLVQRDHMPITTPAPRPPLSSTHLPSKRCAVKSWSPLVICRNSLDDESAPSLEKMTPSLDPERESAEQEVHQEDISPPILTHSEQEALGKPFHSSCSGSKVCASEAPPPLVRYETKQSSRSGQACPNSKVLDSPPVLSLPEDTAKPERNVSKLERAADKCESVKQRREEGRTMGVEKPYKDRLSCNTANRSKEPEKKKGFSFQGKKRTGVDNAVKADKKLGGVVDFAKSSKICVKTSSCAKPNRTREEASAIRPNKRLGEAYDSAKLSKKQNDVCDFAKNIDWQSAVAETVESHPDLTKQEGESKRGIILKIRTKSMAPKAEPTPQIIEPAPEKAEPGQEHAGQVPEKAEQVPAKAEPASQPNPGPNPGRVQRKRHTIDSPEMVSRLRKRQKSGEAEKPPVVEEGQEKKHSKDCEAKSKRQKAGKASGCQCCNRVSPRYRRPRRNTVQLGEDLKAHTDHLTSADRKFVSAAIDLSRLQSQAHDLVCALFPRCQPELARVAPESARFTKIIDDIIAELESCDSKETVLDLEDLSQTMEKLTLCTTDQNKLVPVFSPQVTLCSSPQHSYEEFRGKVCLLLQLLLPDLPVSLNNSLSQSSEDLEAVMKRVLMANKVKAARKCSF